MRYHVNVESAASPEEVQRVLDEAEKHCPYLDVFARAQTVRRILDISSPGS